MEGDAPALEAAIRDFYWRLRRAVDRLLASSGSSVVRTKLLLWIFKNGPLRSGEISEAFDYSPRTTTEAIDALERDGLVFREQDPRDRRAKLVSLTPEGAALLSRSEPAMRQYMDEVFAALELEEQKKLAELLEKLNVRLDMLERER
jgi:DNA-binding MarR family transcriptional regulator